MIVSWRDAAVGVSKPSVAKGVVVYAHFSGEGLLVLLRRSANLANLFFGENCAPVCKASNVALLRNAISHIVLWCSQKKVVWVYAQSVVAAMANMHSGRNWPIRQFVGDSVRVYLPSARPADKAAHVIGCAT